MYTARPLRFLRAPDGQDNSLVARTGLVILHCPIPDVDLLDRVWYNASVRVAADGASNRIYDLLSGGTHDSNPDYYLPDEIHGDLDSIRQDVKEYYQSRGVSVTRDGDQYSTDLQKSIRCVLSKLPADSDTNDDPLDIIILGSLSGRVDQGISLLSELYKQHQHHSSKVRFWLVSESSISFVLDSGSTTIDVAHGIEHGLITENVGILPVYGPAETGLTGFEWDVKGWPTAMGGQISSSNHIKADQLVVETNHPVLFTVERK